MGGLQRSGTTWLEGLVASPLVSGLSFDNVHLSEYESQQPWTLQNHTQAYFEMVVRFGGVEGKFVQNVYPYSYLVRDVGTGGRGFPGSLLPTAADASADSSRRLYQQWSLFWDTTRPVLLEKTPENLLMGPYLQASFGAQTSRFVFVMRHPLVWALAIEKWVFAEFSSLRTVEERIGFWFDCMSRTVAQLPTLRDALLLQLETVSVSTELQLNVSRHLLCDSSATNCSSPSGRCAPMTVPAGIKASTSILSSSLAYVTCWLTGLEYKTSSRRCVSRRPFRDPAYGSHATQLGLENKWRLQQIATRREVEANGFGYTFRPFVKLTKRPQEEVKRARLVADEPMAQAAQLGAAAVPVSLRPILRDYLAVPTPPSRREAPQTVVAPDTAPKTHVMLAYFKMGVDSEKPTGMDIRMSQVVTSLVRLKVEVHFVCHCDVDSSQLSPFGSGVTIYFGSMRQQYEQVMAAVPRLRHALIFFTTLTMFVHQRMVAGQDWHAEPTELLPEEQLVSWLRSERAREPVCAIAVADDIHYIRSVEVMGRYDATKAVAAAVWIRRRELSFHSAVNTVVTVSLEDAATLRGVLTRFEGAAKGAEGRAPCSACDCSLTWVPYVVDPISESAVEPFERRKDGMLYVGGMHGLAVIAIEWLMQHVQASLARQSARGAAELSAGGMGHLHLAGPGWQEHVAANRVLNHSVSKGHVTILGTLTDLQLAQRLQQHKVFVAPVFNGTGIATKNVLAMARGIPLVTTPVGLAGLGLDATQQAVVVAHKPDDFANAVLRMQTSQPTFRSTWRAALAHTRSFLSSERQRAVLCGLLSCTGHAEPAGEGRASKQEPQLCLASTAASGRRQSARGKVMVAADMAADTQRAARAGSQSRPLVVLGLGGSGVGPVASMLQPALGCVLQDPLAGLVSASADAQLDYLQSLLQDETRCSARTTRRLPDRPATFHGFALELSRKNTGALLSTVGGVTSLLRLLRDVRPHVILVRRCNMMMWAAQQLAPVSPCDGTNGSKAVGRSCPRGSASAEPKRQPLPVAKLSTEVRSAEERLTALSKLLNESRCPQHQLDFELLHDGARAEAVKARLKSFLGLPAKAELALQPADRLTWERAVESVVASTNQVRATGGASIASLAPLTQPSAACSKPSPGAARSCAEVSGGECTTKWATGTLASYPRTRLPVLLVGAHSSAGGASVLGKMMLDACRAWLTPTFGIRCAFLESFEVCDPAQADLCFHSQSRFSAGRFTDRGYRFVHFVRNPLDVFTRSFLTANPNVTHTNVSTTSLLARLEEHLRLLLSEELYDMQSISEGHEADPNYLRVRVEDVGSTAGATANSTLRAMFQFLLSPPRQMSTSKPVGSVTRVARGAPNAPGNFPALHPSVWTSLKAAAKSDALGSSQRQRLAKLLVRKPAKCHHLSRIQKELGYAPVACPERAESKRASEQRTSRSRRTSRRARARRRRA